jgi:hypothetical protein
VASECQQNGLYISFLSNFDMDFSKNKLNAEERVAFAKNILHEQFGIVVRFNLIKNEHL